MISCVGWFLLGIAFQCVRGMCFKSASSHWLHVKRISFGKWHFNVFRFILILSSFRYAKWRLGNRSSLINLLKHVFQNYMPISNDKTFLLLLLLKQLAQLQKSLTHKAGKNLKKAMALKKELFLSFAMSLKCTKAFLNLLTTINSFIDNVTSELWRTSLPNKQSHFTCENASKTIKQDDIYQLLVSCRAQFIDRSHRRQVQSV